MSTTTRTKAPASMRPGQWRLGRVQLLNWGTFHGHHSVDIARKGFLLTGHSGSGKSSLVDAISAVLTPRGKVHFNAAAQDTGTRGEDRSIVSYLRGAWKRSADEETGEVRAEYLRPGATFGAIALHYRDGKSGKPVVLVKLYYLRAGSNTPADVSELSLLLTQDVELTEFAAFLRKGIDKRRIDAAFPEAYSTAKHSAFSSKFSRSLGISGDNAIMLLHRTQAAKSLGSLDDLFRQFMLDKPKTFEMAENAVAQFGELSEAHRIVIEARDQIEALYLLEEPSSIYETDSLLASRAAALGSALPHFKDAWKLELAQESLSTARAAEQQARHDVESAATATGAAEDAHLAARTTVESKGGAGLRHQQDRLVNLQDSARDTARRRSELADQLARVGIDFPAGFAEYEELRSTATAERSNFEAVSQQAKEELLNVSDQHAAARARVRELESELSSLHQRRSNLNTRLVAARELVAERAGIPVQALPFAGELMQVREEFSAWTGAIERVLRPLSSVLLVLEAHLPKIRDAVNELFLGARLVYEAIPQRVEPPRPTASERSLLSRVEVADHPMSQWLHGTLSRTYDYACVESAAELGSAERAVTITGQVKRTRSRYEKDDRSTVSDRSHWVLGFDNAAKLEYVGELATTARADSVKLAARRDVLEKRRDAERRRVEALELLESREWDSLDVANATQRVAAQEELLSGLRAASADLAAAEAAAAESKARLAAAHQHQQEKMTVLSTATTRLEDLRSIIDKLNPVVASASGVEPEIAAELKSRFHAVQRKIGHTVIDDVALRVSGLLATEEKQATARVDSARARFTGLAGEFMRRWPAKAADLTSDIADRAGYLAILNLLIADRLPDFEKHFFDLLERQSQQNVAQLNNEIRRAPGEVRDRVTPINLSLKHSAFDAGRFLKIVVKENRSEAARTFMNDLQTIATGSWMSEDRADAEAKFDTMARLMHRLGSSENADRTWQSQCLDTRLHVRFTATEVDAEDIQLNVYDSAAGLSGGQRQKLVTFCLAAALRYQLAEEGEEIPRYGTVIMDEAFDKADSRFTKIAMDVFGEFGFHMVLATPLKLLQTLEEYIGGMAVVTCHDFKDSRIGALSIKDEEPSGEETENTPEPEDPDTGLLF